MFLRTAKLLIAFLFFLPKICFVPASTTAIPPLDDILPAIAAGKITAVATTTKSAATTTTKTKTKTTTPWKQSNHNDVAFCSAPFIKNNYNNRSSHRSTRATVVVGGPSVLQSSFRSFHPFSLPNQQRFCPRKKAHRSLSPPSSSLLLFGTTQTSCNERKKSSSNSSDTSKTFIHRYHNKRVDTSNDENLYQSLLKALFRRIIDVSRSLAVGSILAVMMMLTMASSPPLPIMMPAPAFAKDEIMMVWQLPNGEVRLEDPMSSFPGLSRLSSPQLLGSGGGGAVFAFQNAAKSLASPSASTSTKATSSRSSSSSISGSSSSMDAEKVAIKVSWLRSAESVKRECAVLRELEKARVEGVEQCLGQQSYPPDPRRVMIALTPVVEDGAVSSLAELDPELAQPHAVQCVIRTMVQMMAANVATADVQPLISRTSGDIVFIDMTEAKVFSSSPSSSESGNSKDDDDKTTPAPLSFLDQALASSFCVEMLSLIPESQYPLASTTLLEELKATELNRGSTLSNEFYNILLSQTQFMTQETLEYIDAKVVGPVS